MKSNRHFWTAVIAAWLVFLGIDFLFHASLLANYWNEDIAAIKPESELFQLIPFGYASFLLLCMLLAFLYNAIFKESPTTSEVLGFAVVFSGLFSISNLLGQYSYIDIPINSLILFNLVYFIELIAATFVIHRTSTASKPARVIVYGVAVFLLCLVAGIILQNFS